MHDTKQTAKRVMVAAAIPLYARGAALTARGQRPSTRNVILFPAIHLSERMLIVEIAQG